MEFQNVFQEMLNVTAAPPFNPVAAALQRAGIPTDAPYYAGAFQVVERAVKAAKKAAHRPEQNEYQKDCPDMTAAARRFWQAYLLSLCGHLERLEREAEPEEKPLSQPTAASSPFRGAYSGEDCVPSVSLAAASSAQGTSFGYPVRGAEIERQQLRGGIRTAQAVLYALQETEQTEREPRETA